MMAEMNASPAPAMNAYEHSREQRIRENRETMIKLGILNLSSNLNSLCSKKRISKKPNISCSPKISPDPRPASQTIPVRRSSRLQNVTPISYSEVRLEKKETCLDDEDLSLREHGSKPEIYTEEHENLLGNTERSWMLFVDGYGKDGKRVYDSVKGKTCHQCRQKTLGHRTHCTRCNMVQGQFCGDCLYIRYGEHVLEAMENPDWICPVCRGICNCSLCRQSKGWAPTGSIYRKILKLGYKSVAHYLIQTRRSQKNTQDSLDSTTQLSEQKALAISDLVPSIGSAAINKLDSVSLKHESENQLPGLFNSEMGGKSSLSSVNQVSVKRSLMLLDAEAPSKEMKSAATVSEVNNQLELKPQPEDPLDAGFKSGEQEDILDGEKGGNKKSSEKISILGNTPLEIEAGEEKNRHSVEEKSIGDDNGPQVGPNLKKKRAFAIEPNPDSIAGRLRQRRKITTNA